jgi:hypothetical protein
MHLRVSPAWRCSLQVDLSSAAHCQTNWPCKDHVCLSCESVIVIFSTTAPSTACEKLPMSEGHHPRASSALRFLTQLLATPQYARTSVNGFCDDGVAKWVRSQAQNSHPLHLRVRVGPPAQQSPRLATLPRSTGRERIWQLKNQKSTEYPSYVYTLAPPAFRANV